MSAPSPKSGPLASRLYVTAILVVNFAAILLIAPVGHAWQHDQQSGMSGMQGMNTDPNRKCDDMGSSVNSMSVMGQSMAAMTNHMCITPLRPMQPGDLEKVQALIAQIKVSIEKYKDYKKALADGYVIANPKVEQPQFHFTNDAYVRLADTQWDPTKPSSLLYWHTPTERFRLEGVMYTDSTSATLDELNQRIPLSIARWHEHTNFCAAPANKVSEYHGENPKFGMFGSIHTAAACKAEGGTFFPIIFSWMIHVFPYETNLKDVFSMDDDIPHVH
ncbi:MAG TPA: hypothetical protein VMD92_05870 [Acidobacteriaceae bacterium]|nr:hypothetical protein [Acidobacteriaceae bacterium]